MFNEARGCLSNSFGSASIRDLLAPPTGFTTRWRGKSEILILNLTKLQCDKQIILF